jgi:hypothetical protein
MSRQGQFFRFVDFCISLSLFNGALGTQVNQLKTEDLILCIYNIVLDYRIYSKKCIFFKNFLL